MSRQSESGSKTPSMIQETRPRPGTAAAHPPPDPWPRAGPHQAKTCHRRSGAPDVGFADGSPNGRGVRAEDAAELTGRPLRPGDGRTARPRPGAPGTTQTNIPQPAHPAARTLGGHPIATRPPPGPAADGRRDARQTAAASHQANTSVPGPPVTRLAAAASAPVIEARPKHLRGHRVRTRMGRQEQDGTTSHALVLPEPPAASRNQYLRTTTARRTAGSNTDACQSQTGRAALRGKIPRTSRGQTIRKA
jgi:hypothetical protein